MAKSEKYDYYKSELLDLEYAVSKNRHHDSRIHFEDGVVYQWPEIVKIKGMEKEKLIKIHNLKKKYPAYNFDEILTMLECTELDQEYFNILRETFNGHICSEK
jgi:hypothetical protein